MDMLSSERAYPTQQDLQVFSNKFKVAGCFGRWGYSALEKETRRPAGLGGGWEEGCPAAGILVPEKEGGFS
jgi:hypothetical protein